MQKQYFLGVDVGGTKSHALIADETGQALGLGASGPGNWEIVGWDGAHQVLQDIVQQACTAAEIQPIHIAGAGFGLAGYDWPEDREPHRQMIDSLGFSAPYEFGNDTLVGLVAGAREGWGVVVVAGTSNNCRGRAPNGREGRMTGSSAFGEYAGAGELVTKAVQAVALAWSCRGPATHLTEAFIRLVGATDVVDLLAGIMRGRYHLSAEHARLIFRIAAEGDEVAQSLITWAGQELGGLANGVIRQLQIDDLGFDVVLSGSFYNGSSHLIETMRQTIHTVAPQARLVRLNAPPVTGGVLLGMRLAGVDAAACRDRLIATTSDLQKVSSR
ncbi:MAG: ATPase [Chloroflexi bacterium]|nr:ATPase [Chloroflexota bacterium]MBP8055294.1 ATPase [Chloroflexota bacterium]